MLDDLVRVLWLWWDDLVRILQPVWSFLGFVLKEIIQPDNLLDIVDWWRDQSTQAEIQSIFEKWEQK